LRSLDLVNGVEHDHSFRTFGGVILKGASVGIATPNFELNVHRDSSNRDS
jgi:hypothetical protein